MLCQGYLAKSSPSPSPKIRSLPTQLQLLRSKLSRTSWCNIYLPFSWAPLGMGIISGACFPGAVHGRMGSLALAAVRRRQALTTGSAVPELGSGTPTGTYVFRPMGGGGPSVYIPPSVHQRAQKTFSQLALRQHAPGVSRGL
jgi:hypothetical protein